MCGIVGFNFKNMPLLKKMADTISHRGPDSEGYFVDNGIMLGHRRLSVIDLSELGQQPMTYNNITIVFNGEIYNYIELREELQLKGYIFETHSDTEVIINAYKEWGTNCVSKFNGMWAFCIYDKQEQKLFLSRDRFGIKPLYYYFFEEKFIFASELKAIKVHDILFKINKEAVNYYFYQKYIGNRLSIFDNVYKLQAAENLIFDINSKKITRSNYYDIREEVEKQKTRNIKEKLIVIKEILNDAVTKRLIADVPVGSFLSGGLDSSLISAIIVKTKRKLKTFSIGFKQKSFNELKFSELVADYIKAQHKTMKLEINEELLIKTIAHFDEPFGDSSVLPTFLLSKMTKDDVTVSLSGDAADEIFGGYDVYKAYKISKLIPDFTKPIFNFLIKQLPVSEKKVSYIFKLKRFLRTNHKNVVIRHLDWLSTFPRKEREKLLTNNYQELNSFFENSQKNDLLSIQINDIKNYLEGDILKKVDIASMLNSLEVRVPFLDHRLVSLVLSLPESYKIKGLETKWYLKQIGVKYLPRKIVYRKKRGFTIPISNIIKNNKLIRSFLLEERFFLHNYISFSYTKQLFIEHANNKKDNSRQLWLIFVFNYWYNHTIVN
jgi:asparagine synthase (glutamine-hydrolysing)